MKKKTFLNTNTSKLYTAIYLAGLWGIRFLSINCLFDGLYQLSKKTVIVTTFCERLQKEPQTPVCVHVRVCVRACVSHYPYDNPLFESVQSQRLCSTELGMMRDEVNGMGHRVLRKNGLQVICGVPKRDLHVHVLYVMHVHLHACLYMQRVIMGEINLHAYHYTCISTYSVYTCSFTNILPWSVVSRTLSFSPHYS